MVLFGNHWCPNKCGKSVFSKVSKEKKKYICKRCNESFTKEEMKGCLTKHGDNK